MVAGPRMISCKRFLLVFCATIFFKCATVDCRVLTPPMFNLAEGRRINATATCGDLNGRPMRERYCYLAGATSYSPFSSGTFSYGNDFAELRIASSPANENIEPRDVVEGGQSCSYCDSSVADQSHPAENMVDGSPRWWQSPPLSRGMEYNQVNITVDLEQEFHVAYVSILMANSPRPGLWVLERSTDYGQTYKPWQYFAENPSQCEEFFGSESLQPVLDDDSVICSTDYSQIVPLENGQIYVTLLNDRPNRANFSHSEKLQEFTQATNVRLRLLRTKTLQGHLMDLNDKKDPTITRRYFYAIKEIEMGGRCVCNGHAETCDILDSNRPTRLLCRCEHNTCGDQCDVCCPGFEQKRWQPTREKHSFQCEPCNCFGHSEECSYDEEVGKLGSSLDIHGNAEGGGVCRNCRDNTGGVNCNECALGFYRQTGTPLNATDVCEPCKCDPHLHTGACEGGSGRCECRASFVSPDCAQCSPGHYDYPRCKLCDCHVNGTASSVCLPENGACPCKPNYAATLCDACVDGFYGFPECQECRCEDLGAVNKQCSKESGACQCKINYGGQRCEVCADGYFNHPSCSYCDCDHSGTVAPLCDKVTATCFCKAGFAGLRCDKCNDTFYAYPDCKHCACDPDGSNSDTCHSVSGQCPCKASFSGKKCNKCSPGFYNYPKCLPCACNEYGAQGITCNDQGLCFCKSNFDGAKCEKCKHNFFNYPLCEECNCDRRGISRLFPGCDKVPVGQLCSCKQRVSGRLCNECKATFWNLQAYNDQGCQECDCNVNGTLSMLSDCGDVSGQCQCKAHVSGRDCTSCKAGFYNLQSTNHYGCQPCICDIGGSFSSICDSKTGQCHCKPKITGRNCAEPIMAHFFPTLMHLQYEAEDGRSVEGREVRFATDETLFPRYSWRGYAVFSPIQDEILLTVSISKPSLYRLVFHYVNPTTSDITVHVQFKPFYANSHSPDDVSQEVDAKIPVSHEPKSIYVSKNGGGNPFPFVLNPGHWALHIKTKPRLLLDYVALLPATYYEGTVLRQHIRNPCLLDDAALKERETSDANPQPVCQQYTYPKISASKSGADQVFFDQDGTRTTALSSAHPLVESKLGATAFLDQSLPYVVQVAVEKPGNYVVVIDYLNFLEQVFPINVDLSSEGQSVNGSINFHHCPYSEFCREVVSAMGQPLAVPSSGAPVKVTLTPVQNISVHLANLFAVLQPEFLVDYLLPKSKCIVKNGKCMGSDFLTPPGSMHFEVEAHADPELKITAASISQDGTDSPVHLLPLNASNTVLDIRGQVPNPDHYVIVVHYYNPTFANVDLDVLFQSDHQIDNANSSSTNAHISLPYCPSVSGCRSTVQRVSQDSHVASFPAMKDFALKLFLRQPAQTVYMDYVMPVPLHNFAQDILDPLSSQRSAEFLSKCQHVLLHTNATQYDEYCKERIFSLTSDYNMGSVACHCDGDGSTSFVCAPFGGQCPCKPHVIGRQCTMCSPGFTGFPHCQPCKCAQGQQCDPRTGQCVCPLHVQGQQCDVCKPYAFGYDSLIGCQECECNTHGTVDGTPDCDPMLGQCKCKENVGGRKCDKCLAGFYAFPHCDRCNCVLDGSLPEVCNQTTAACMCKPNVQGPSCNECVAGAFSLQAKNPKGCTGCFCFGVTSQCKSSSFVKTKIIEMDGWNASGAGQVKRAGNSVEFTPNAEAQNGKARAFYFVAPKQYLGKLTNSYGAKLTYRLSSSSESSARILSADVVLKGVNESVEFWVDELPPDANAESEISVYLTPEHWHKGDGTVTRATLMHILNNVTALLIKASFFENIRSARLSDVALEAADEDANQVGDQATNVEVCTCPAGYSGHSCELCADGYYRAALTHAMGSQLGACVPCQCNGHSSSCDKVSGVCVACQHDAVGDHCQQCDVGLYGAATRGHPSDCRVCPCPLPHMQNNFATSCVVNDLDQLHSCQCRHGYTGITCDRCGIGWFGHPTAPGGFCHPCSCSENNNLTIPGSCDPTNGVCSLCQYHTMGNKCEICESWFHGDAVEKKDCKACSCNQCGSHHCNHTTGSCHCKPNVEGDDCDKCVANAFGFDACYGCRMCKCAAASVSTQCNHETGACTCQPGVAGLECHQCEQGYWNYRETGCVKCDCEADLSLGTVCDVATGQCHCMDGATGPRCDQCVEGYLRVPDYGCRYCDRCVHVLVEDLDLLDVRMKSLERDIGNVSFAYLTSKRLERISDTLNDVRVLSQPILNQTSDEAAQAAKQSAEQQKASIDDTVIKAKRLELANNKSLETTNMLTDTASQLHRDIDENAAKIHDLVRKLQQLSGSIQSGPSTTQYRDQLISDANQTLADLQSVNFSPVERSLADTISEADKMLESINATSSNTTKLKHGIAVASVNAQLLTAKLNDLRSGLHNASSKAFETDQLNDLNKKHPLFVLCQTLYT